MQKVNKYFDDFCDYLHNTEPQIFDEFCKNVNCETHYLYDFLKQFVSKYEKFVDQKENEDRIDYLCENPPI